jgi:O-antigen ligase
MIASAIPGSRQKVRRDTRFSFLSQVITWMMVVLMVVPPGLDYANVQLDDGGNPVSRMMLMFILAAGALVAMGRARITLRVLRNTNPFLIAFLLLATASVVWSIDPALTARRLFRLLIQCSVFITVAVAAWERQRFQRVLRPAITAIMIGSIIFGLLKPELAIHQETSAELLHSWHGLTTSKNILGAIAAVGLILWVHAWMTKSASIFAILVGIGTTGACLLLSRSSTSLMSAVLACSVMLLLLRTPGSLKRSMPYLIGGLSFIILLYALAMLKVVSGLEIILSPIPAITGKDLTFTGRSDIWAAVVTHIRMRPLLGSGFGAYWTGPIPGTESFPVKAILHGFYPGSAHNGYLDVINDLGAIGFVCLAGFILRYISDALRLYAIDRAQGALYIALFLQQTIGNLSESAWFNVTNAQFVFITIATTCLARSLSEHQRSR